MQKVIFLVDMNAFFISCEMTRNQELTGKPAAVAGDPKNRTGIILAANYEARKYGVKTAMVLHQAKKLCPEMLIVPPDHNFYEQKSKEVMNILEGYTPILEINSIDEAWLDMTGCEALSGKPLDAAKKIIDNIRNELGLWCSIGISENKFLAKMASEMKKPLGITELWKEDVQFKLWPLPVNSMYGIGKQTAEKLNNMGIKTIGDLARFDTKTLVKRFGKYGLEIYQFANGMDDSSVLAHTIGEMKSIGRSTTLPNDITDFENAKIVLMSLADEVGADARRHNKKGRTIQITIKYNDFSSVTRQTTIKPTYLTKEICNESIKLLEKNWNSSRPVRLLGVSLGGFSEDYGIEQLSLFSMPELESRPEREEKLERVLDAIREKHGSCKINRAVLMKSSDEKINNQG